MHLADCNSINRSESSAVMEHSPLNKLPAEIRNRISELAVIRPGPLRVMREARKFETDVNVQNHNDTDNKTLHVCALTKTCKQLRSETRKMFYPGNSFTITLGQAILPKYRRRNEDRILKRLDNVMTLLKQPDIDYVQKLDIRIRIPRCTVHGGRPTTFGKRSFAMVMQAMSVAQSKVRVPVFFTLNMEYYSTWPTSKHPLRDNVKICVDASRFEESCQKGAKKLTAMITSGHLDCGHIYALAWVMTYWRLEVAYWKEVEQSTLLGR